MFVNGAALAATLRLLAILAVVLAGVLVAHLVWVRRLARSPGLAAERRPVRILLVASALVTPVVSFYAVEIAALWQRRTTVAWASIGRRLAILAALTLVLAAAFAAREEARYLPGSRTGWDAAGRFLRLARFLMILQFLLFMILRVFADSRRPALAWGALLMATAILVAVLW